MTEQVHPVSSEWHLERRSGSGNGSGIFAVSKSGGLLFRVELSSGKGAMVYAWDKKASREVSVSVDDLIKSVLTLYGKTP